MATTAAEMTTRQARSQGSGLTRQFHGLPVWTWVFGATILVAGGYTLLKRRQAARQPAPSASTAPAISTTAAYNPSPDVANGFSQLAGELASFAGNQQGPVSSAPALSPATPSADTTAALAAALQNPGTPPDAALAQIAQAPPQVQSFLSGVASSPNPGYLQQFFAQNVARQQEGLPFYTQAGLFDPRTGLTTATKPGGTPYWLTGTVPQGSAMAA